MTQRKFEKGEKYRPVVTVTKVKKNTPTVIEYEGNRYILQHKNQYRGGSSGKSRR